MMRTSTGMGRPLLLPLQLLLALTAAFSLKALPPPEIPGDVLQAVRQRVDAGLQVGLVVGMIDPKGTTYFCYGKASKPDGPPLKEGSVFEIGSISKVFTSLLLADMALQGELKLDDPIQKHLPDGVQAPTRNGEEIRLIHLAEHSSGLPRMPNNFRPGNLGNPYADYSTDQLLEFLAGHRLRRDVGSQYEYSNYGVGLLG
ncbi:MAG: serine hydrolase domain-containing protein, partial [Acidobacteriota bacterium]